MSASGVGIGFVIPNSEGTKSSGGINGIVPPSNCALHDIGLWGSRTTVMKPKSARQARGGSSLDIRMFACWMLGGGLVSEWENTNSFEISMAETRIVDVL